MRNTIEKVGDVEQERVRITGKWERREWVESRSLSQLAQFSAPEGERLTEKAKGQKTFGCNKKFYKKSLTNFDIIIVFLLL